MIWDGLQFQVIFFRADANSEDDCADCGVEGEEEEEEDLWGDRDGERLSESEHLRRGSCYICIHGRGRCGRIGFV